MCSATSSEGSQLIRSVVPCAQSRVAIARFERPAQQATEPRAKRVDITKPLILHIQYITS
jgi:hypothetical protein